MGLKFRPLRAEEVECRVAQVNEKSVNLLLYKTARTDMELLDEAVGPLGWQDRYESIDGKMFCRIGIKDGDEWVWKGDTGTESNMEAQKGEASDARKRAGFAWGIGRELYTAPKIWVPRDKCTQIKKGRNGKEQCYDDFRVTELAVDGGQIVKLEIRNMSNGGVVVYGRAKAEPKSKPRSGRFAKLNALMKEAAGLGVSEEGMKSYMNANVLKGKPLKDATDDELSACEQYVATVANDKRALMGDG